MINMDILYIYNIFEVIFMENFCCFIGHRRIENNKDLRQKLNQLIEKLIVEENVTTFLFGSKSQFDDLCHETVTCLKEKYPQIKRVYVRAEYPYINDQYRTELLKDYEDTYFPESLLHAGRAVYVERNYKMIEQSNICVFYYAPSLAPTTRNSGTKLALDYAQRKNKEIILLP